MSQVLEKPITIEGLRERREEILRVARACGAIRVRVFGSVARGEATSESDVDFLVQFQKGASLWDAVGLWQDLSELLGCTVNVVSEGIPHDRFLDNALRDAVEL
jgi:hypothetical protein